MSVTINGSAGVTTNSGAVYDSLQRGTAVTASGTSVDFTSIPSWVKRVTVMWSGLSTSGTSNIIVQLGSTSFTTTGYLGCVTTFTGGSQVNFTSGFIFSNGHSATDIQHGQMIISNISSNNWCASSISGLSSAASGRSAAGYVPLSGTLDRIRITTAGGTDTFDAGTINIIYE